MWNNIFKLFVIYRQFGFIRALWSLLRVLILPYRKIDEIVPDKGVIFDIGCGTGAFTNFLALSSPKRRVFGIDLSKNRISLANKTTGRMADVRFILGDVTRSKMNKFFPSEINSADCYLLIDVLHHIPYKEQEKLLKFLTKKLTEKSVIVIKDVDRSNTLPFLFGHLWEKALYPKERIYVRSKQGWANLFSSLRLFYKVTNGAFYFPDSTLVFTCRLKS